MTDSIITSRLDGIRIGILHHSGSKLVRQGYLIDSMADLWKGRGAEVVDIVGTEQAEAEAEKEWASEGEISTDTLQLFLKDIGKVGGHQNNEED